MKAENRAFVPQIQEWPPGPPGGVTGTVRTGRQPTSRHLAALSLILHRGCTGQVLAVETPGLLRGAHPGGGESPLREATSELVHGWP